MRALSILLLFLPTILQAASARLGDVAIAGVVADGATLNTVAIEKVNDACSAPGGGGAEDAAVELPEEKASNPEMRMFGKVIPASGIHVRNTKGITFKNVTPENIIR